MGADRCWVEQLEGRRFLSGSVSITFENGLLRIIGDDAANAVFVQRTYEDPDPSTIEVHGLDGTLINGVTQRGPFRFSGVRDIEVRMNGGDDEIHFVGLRLQGGMNIEGGTGDDAVYIRKSRVLGNTVVRSGHSADALTVADTFFGNDLIVDGRTGRAPPSVAFRPRPFGFIVLPFGFAQWSADTRGPTSVSLRDSVFSDNLSITTGPADDRLTMNNCWVEGFSGFATGDGDDFVSIDNGTEFKQATGLDDGEGDDQIYHEVVRRFDFNRGGGEQGWQFDAANYTLGPGRTLENYRLDSGVRQISPSEGPMRTGYFLRGDNNSDMLFLFISRMLAGHEGLRPNTDYQTSFAITLATNVPANSFNLPHSLIVGALGRRPEVRVLDESLPTGRLIGNDGESPAVFPAELNAVGDVKNHRIRSLGDDFLPFAPAHYAHEFTATARSDGVGRLWLIAGVGSSFEGGGAIYFERITVRLRPVA